MKTGRPSEQAVKRVHGMPFGSKGRDGVSPIRRLHPALSTLKIRT